MINLFSFILENGGGGGGGYGAVQEVVNQIAHFVNIAVIVFITTCCILGVLLAIWIGSRLVVAQDDQKRSQAKYHIMWTVIGIVFTVIVDLIFVFGLGAMRDASEGFNAPDEGLNIAISLSLIVMDMIIGAAVVAAIFIGWQMVTAEDEAKRRQAKMRLFWAFLATVGIVLLTAFAHLAIGGLGGAGGGGDG